MGGGYPGRRVHSLHGTVRGPLVGWVIGGGTQPQGVYPACLFDSGRHSHACALRARRPFIQVRRTACPRAGRGSIIGGRHGPSGRRSTQASNSDRGAPTAANAKAQANTNAEAKVIGTVQPSPGMGPVKWCGPPSPPDMHRGFRPIWTVFSLSSGGVGLPCRPGRPRLLSVRLVGSTTKNLWGQRG